MLYTWENPAGPRILIFEGHKRKEIENDLRKDGIGDFMYVYSKRTLNIICHIGIIFQ